MYLKTSELYTLYYQVKKRRMPSEKLITISGDFNSKIQVFLVKLGTKVMDLVKTFYQPSLEDYEGFRFYTIQITLEQAKPPLVFEPKKL